MAIPVSGSNNRILVVGGLLPRTSYTFRVRAQGASESQSALLLLQVSTMQLCSTDVTILCVYTELGFFLRGTLYPDNSIVLLSDIYRRGQ